MLRRLLTFAPPVALLLVGVLLVEPPYVTPADRVPTLRLLTGEGQRQASQDSQLRATLSRAARAKRAARPRLVGIKAEVVQLAGRAPQDNPRFVVTNLRQTPRFIYERIYCARGDIENRSKSCTTGSRSVGPAAVASGRINCASSSPPRPMC